MNTTLNKEQNTIVLKNLKLTVTDCLRVAVHMSGGDISLPKVPRKFIKSGRYGAVRNNEDRSNFKFKSFTRPERRIILSLLEKTNCDATEATLKAQRWVKLGHSLHAGEYAKKFPKAVALFNSVRNENVQSWYGKVNQAFSSSFEEGLKVLSQRPGEFMRKLDWLLRTESFSINKQVKGNVLQKYATQKPHIANSFKKLSLDERVTIVLNVFKTIAAKVSNKVLYEVYSHFEDRYVEKTNRTIMIKGSRKRTTLPNLPAISPETIESVQRLVVATLISKFAILPKFGKVYVDENLKKIPLPTNMRSMSSSLKPVIRGSRIPMDNQNAKVIRPFLHFEKNSTSITIDLSVVMIGAKNGICDWRTHKIGNTVIHSGDSFGRTGACAEYVDIDVAKALKEGFKYALIQLHNYNNSPELYDNNHFGVMEREFPEKNRTWLPSTLSNCSIIRVERIVNCAIIDLETREYIMVDEDSSTGGWLQVASTLDFKAVQDYIKLPKISVYDLLLMHVEAREGELVEANEKADTYLTFEDFSTSYVNTLKYMGI